MVLQKDSSTKNAKSNGATETWGREKDVDYCTLILTGLLFFLSPLFVIYCWFCLEKFNGSLIKPLYLLYSTGLNYDSVKNWGLSLLPEFTWESVQLYGLWYAFHAISYVWLPSKIGYGQETPAGHVLPYRVNGLRVWIITHASYIIFSYVIPIMDPAIIQKNWGGLLVATNIYGFLLTILSYIKAHVSPTHPEDRKFSGSVLYDMFMGIELNPRIGDFDFKLFHNGRPGITAWTLINLSFAAAQYQRHGYVSNSMILLNFLHALYVVDFFYFEDWYLRTIDIAHDHFGFYLAWGDSVWLPFMYTLQAQYLYRNPVNLGNAYLLFIFLLGTGGYYIFRNVNNQKDLARKKNGELTIWGKPAKIVRAQYVTTDGQHHTSILLASGYWGLSRHFNYVGDLMMCLAFCLTCGLDTLLPHFYFIYMVILLIHRVHRDQSRCSGKYGKYWDDYCALVPYKVIPYVY